jgi:molybdate transport system substrate-binding protein
MWLVSSFRCIASKNHLRAAIAASVLVLASEALANDTNVAVAANFTEPAKEIAQLFQSSTG